MAIKQLGRMEWPLLRNRLSAGQILGRLPVRAWGRLLCLLRVWTGSQGRLFMNRRSL